MKRMYLPLSALGLAFLTLSGIAVLAPLWAQTGRCGEEYDRINRALAGFDILAVAPPGAVPRGERTASCDTDDYFASIGLSYRPDRRHDSLQEVETFYRSAALRHGWKIVPAEDSPNGEECVIKEVAGDPVNLSVWFPPDAAGDYDVSVSTWPC
ncbi:hypothetical protein HNP84_006366 [Thermocatellispora tengchongensis]|uniref:Uncharacterized protein n=1 Tax=Thermocatellispora tengchongensis TaxID=1073253 RepID=A0A840PKN1_9ACTN|nr:hypothetical protein [Thermocatellispora tengchongensis]MBB5136615.1 hypothetical protein [Thermocatellispora tengchongensis]